LISTLEKEVTFRFLKARKKDGFLNVISIFSFIGISLGVAVLIIVMSVMNGFRTELINKIVGFNPHVTVKPYNNQIDYKNYDKVLKTISENLVLSNSSEAIIIRDQNSKGVLLRGYLGEDFSKLELINNKNFLGQNKKIEKNSISIGRELSFNLDLNIGDNITLMSSSGVETIIGNLPKQKTFIITSIFESGLAEFDNNVIFLNLNTLEEFSNLSTDERNLEIYLKDPKNIEQQKNLIQKNYPNDLVFTWADMNRSLFFCFKS
jgi:lipoprotein-releasing system permease protein